MFETRMQIRQAARAKVRAEGRREGRKEGRAEGRQEGRLEGRRAIVDVLRRYAVRDEATGRIVLELTPEVEAALLNDPDHRG